VSTFIRRWAIGPSHRCGLPTFGDGSLESAGPGASHHRQDLQLGTLAPVPLPERQAGERLERLASRARPHRSQARRLAENESLGALLHRHR